MDAETSTNLDASLQGKIVIATPNALKFVVVKEKENMKDSIEVIMEAIRT